jgi:hypothetical protein
VPHSFKIALLLVLSCLVCNYCWLAVCIVLVLLCVLLLSYVYLLYYERISVTLDAGLLARSQYSEGTAAGPSTQGFLGFAVTISECQDVFQDSKLPLHASHVVLPA